jgi:glycosyltransferase involved in cell wall biosynthesis
VDILTEVAVVRNNFVVNDTSLGRIIRSLSKKYSTAVFGWNREGRDSNNIEKLKREILDDNDSSKTTLLKILKLRAPVNEASLVRYLPLLLFFPLFWIWVFTNLIIYRPEIVHSCDLDTVIPCYAYKKIFQKKIIFYVFDRYALTFIPKKFNLLFRAIHSIEEYYSSRSDVLVTVSEKVLDSFKKRPKRCSIILNSPEDYKNGAELKRVAESTFKIVYGGHIMSGRGLENVCSAIKDLKNVELFIHGLVIDKKILDEIRSVPNVRYKGYLTSCRQYYKSIMSADAMIAIYDPNKISYGITMHNKTFEAMMCGIPLITNLSPQFVKELGFGIIVDYGNVDEIRAAIVTLRDNHKLRETLGKNGRKSYLDKYNWKEAEKELYNIYDHLLSPD